MVGIVECPTRKEPRSRKSIVIGEVEVVALIDTGVATNFMREDVRREISSKSGKETKTEFDGTMKGFGGAVIKPEGQAVLRTILDGHEYNLEYAIVPAQATVEKVVIGDPLLSAARVTLETNRLAVEPLERVRERQRERDEKERAQEQFVRETRVLLHQQSEIIVVMQRQLQQLLQRGFQPSVEPEQHLHQAGQPGEGGQGQQSLHQDERPDLGPVGELESQAHRPKEKKRRVTGKCFHCGERGHKGSDCPEKSEKPRCFKCDGDSHFARDCTGQRASPKNTKKTKMKG